MNTLQAIYDNLYARAWDSAGYEIKTVATVENVEAGLTWLRNKLVELKADPDRAAWNRMAKNYDECSEAFEAWKQAQRDSNLLAAE